MSAAVTDLSDGTAYVRPDHVDPGCTLPCLPTPPSVNKTIALRTRTVSLDSKVRKPLFRNSEDEGKATELGDEVLENTKYLGETDKVIKDTVVDLESTVGPTPLPKKDKP